ncbi:hypothetical protein AAJ76_820006659 [Vairimorpha ceranae]|uniref:Uncharacterized protein n=1 Tax=Vairimorpha ceranae TaxID=40302 RepID=A0A0F9WMP9_9MICR|nr:hypothetical protein AAJ76_820006659 [Vairimorpha ceranae]KKO74328.1 hypothetical protein AAJ76_820006659 [Vairimorpha ceranae]
MKIILEHNFKFYFLPQEYYKNNFIFVFKIALLNYVNRTVQKYILNENAEIRFYMRI